MYITPERLQELITIIRTGDHLAFYSTKEWRYIRNEVRKRDNNECQECKRQGKVFTNKSEPDKRKRLDVDHIKELEDYPDLCLTMDNLITLCIRCHNKKHDRYQKKESKWDDERW
ncbi:HNH endonuclease [Lysinibacillus yapensis]|uniref:HNH endonuclease n=1 Tax=Ureibacillus yapensis TaxID=2304605 RepID=A0A396SBH1_9BACL|nr:HNH endonuclease [Lysinibacillus yapensis]